jgi:thiosulfate/3-mercaptopyruvate sulfurtransferase
METFTTLITPEDLARHLAEPHWRVFDCRFSLDDPDRGRRDYGRSRIPGALYLHLDEDLSAPVIPGVTGRHPLPDPVGLAQRLTRQGVTDTAQVVAYDDAGGSVAARLWWLLKWIGHEAVAVLDGGWPVWCARGLPVESGPPSPPAPWSRGNLQVGLREGMVAGVGEVAKLVEQGCSSRLVDARSPERFRGDFEPIDPVAGHIPGACNHPFQSNLGPDGRFRPITDLRLELEALCGALRPEELICYCGSGVTGALNVLAFEHAGLGRPRLYAGSWSEWITDPRRPVAKAG